mmetsp:Transcript_63339/g.160325  ORF Transcript_63339/g.160325 Transcript_63339/m.160325 type:complete len:523 (-) Transcript_63339:101-1669(-)
MFEIILCILHLAQTSARIWNGESTWIHLLNRNVGSPAMSICTLIFTGVRSVPVLLCFEADIANMMVFVAVTGGDATDGQLRGFAGMCVAMLFVILAFLHMMHTQWRALYEAQQELAMEKEASGALLSMVCDAAFWMAADDCKILRSDVRLDEIFGAAMVNRQLCDFMPEEEKQRLWSNTVGTSDRAANDPAILLPSTLYSSWQRVPTNVDLFIIDRRTLSTAALDGEKLGFLIGVRLATPLHIAPAATAQALQHDHIGHCATSAAACTENTASGLPCAGRVSVAGSSVPDTLDSVVLPPPQMHHSSRADIEMVFRGEASLLELPSLECPQTRATLLATLSIMCEHASGGALVCVADPEAFREVFNACPHNGASAGAVARSCDKGYMTDRLQGIHVSDARFAEAFHDFTLHSDGDRWPDDHPDKDARGRPKDGAFLLSKSGYRVKCATKLLGLQPAASWANIGTKHEAALACAWAVQGSFVFVRSDSGSLHIILRHRHTLHIHALHSWFQGQKDPSNREFVSA